MAVLLMIPAGGKDQRQTPEAAFWVIRLKRLIFVPRVYTATGKDCQVIF